MRNSIPITAGTITYWVGLVGDVLFVPSTNDGITNVSLGRPETVKFATRTLTPDQVGN